MNDRNLDYYCSLEGVAVVVAGPSGDGVLVELPKPNET